MGILYKTFEDKWKRPCGNIWIYSDPHFADAEMQHLRHNYIGDNEQVKRINAKVGKNDTLIILGDIGDTSYISKLRARYKILIIGNHDKGASNYRREIKEIEHNSDTCPKCGGHLTHDFMTVHNCGYGYAYCHKCGTVECKEDVYADNHLFDEVYEGPLMISEKLLLSHEPIPVPEYMFNIHGHDHANREGLNNTQHLNVCAEHINYEPVSLLKLIKDGLLSNIQDIHKLTVKTATERKQKRNANKNSV